MKLHYPHRTLTGKDLAKGFARAERQFDRGMNDKENLSNVEGQILAFGQVLRLLGVQDDRARD